MTSPVAPRGPDRKWLFCPEMAWSGGPPRLEVGEAMIVGRSNQQRICQHPFQAILRIIVHGVVPEEGKYLFGCFFRKFDYLIMRGLSFAKFLEQLETRLLRVIYRFIARLLDDFMKVCFLVERVDDRGVNAVFIQVIDQARSFLHENAVVVHVAIEDLETVLHKKIKS